MIITIEHAEERYGNWYVGVPGRYAVFDSKGEFTGEWVYHLP